MQPAWVRGVAPLVNGWNLPPLTDYVYALLALQLRLVVGSDQDLASLDAKNMIKFYGCSKHCDQKRGCTTPIYKFLIKIMIQSLESHRPLYLGLYNNIIESFDLLIFIIII